MFVSYVELHAHSAFSFLDGASLPDELAVAARELGHEALALTDHDNVCGAMEHAQACKAVGLRALHGAELTLDDGRHLTLLVEDERGWRNLCRLVTRAHAHTRGDEPQERDRGMPGAGGGPAPGVRSPLPSSASVRDPAARPARRRPRPRRRARLPQRLRAPTGSTTARRCARCATRSGPSACASSCSGPTCATIARATAASPRSRASSSCAAVATGNVHAHARARAPLQDALVAVAPPHDARRLRAAAARQLQPRAREPAGDGGALRRRPSGGRRGDAPRSQTACAST